MINSKRFLKITWTLNGFQIEAKFVVTSGAGIMQEYRLNTVGYGKSAKGNHRGYC